MQLSFPSRNCAKCAVEIRKAVGKTVATDSLSQNYLLPHNLTQIWTKFHLQFHPINIFKSIGFSIYLVTLLSSEICTLAILKINAC